MLNKLVELIINNQQFKKLIQHQITQYLKSYDLRDWKNCIDYEYLASKVIEKGEIYENVSPEDLDYTLLAENLFDIVNGIIKSEDFCEDISDRLDLDEVASELKKQLNINIEVY
jgi:hypothetical protein